MIGKHYVLRYLPTERKRKAMAMEKEVRDSFTSMINGRLNRRKTGEQGVQDLLDLFLDDLYHGNVSYNRARNAIIEEAIAQCKLFYFAGFDTTSNLLVWTLVTLASHQNWQARAREEVFQVLGDSNNLTSDNLNQLKTVSTKIQSSQSTGLVHIFSEAMQFGPLGLKMMRSHATPPDLTFIFT